MEFTGRAVFCPVMVQGTRGKPNKDARILKVEIKYKCARKRVSRSRRWCAAVGVRVRRLSTTKYRVLPSSSRHEDRRGTGPIQDLRVLQRTSINKNRPLRRFAEHDLLILRLSFCATIRRSISDIRTVIGGPPLLSFAFSPHGTRRPN